MQYNRATSTMQYEQTGLRSSSALFPANTLKHSLYLNPDYSSAHCPLSSSLMLSQQRLYVSEEELRGYWETLALVDMEEILTITDQKLIDHIWNYISYYIASKRNNSIKNAYIVKEEGQPESEALMWCYDCRIFKNSSIYTKDENQCIGAFILRYKDNNKFKTPATITAQSKEPTITNSIGSPSTIVNTTSNGGQSKLQRDAKYLYEFINPALYEQKRTILKCKASYLLKIFSLFNTAYLEPIRGDVIVLTEDLYFKFIYNWTHFSNSWEVEPMILHLFKGLLILMQNQILLNFFRSLSEKEREVRRYQKPVLVLQKPKLKSTFTMIEEGLGDVSWATLRIPAFKIKYRVVESENSYVCFRVKDELFEAQSDQQLPEQDAKIIQCFSKLRQTWETMKTNF